MITLYLCRHGIAEDATDGMSDDDRKLTSEGIKKFRKAAKGLLQILRPKDVSHILTSPLLRARQTAEILADVLDASKHDVAVQIVPSLKPGTPLPAFLKTVRALPRPNAVIAVGHEPTLSEWLGTLCFDRPGRVELRKGAIAAIELAPTGPKGHLLALLQPHALRQAR
jgi:phosphohistidine phosphatase